MVFNGAYHGGVCYFVSGGSAINAPYPFIVAEYNDLEHASEQIDRHAHELAAILVEPMLGAGGCIAADPDFLRGLRDASEHHGIVLIFDEVISGFGRTGQWFGAQHFRVTPDLITFAKGATSGYLPLSGVIASRRVCEAFEEPGFVFRTGYTYSGHPASCAAGIANLELMDAEGLVDRANHVGGWIRSGLEALQADGLIESWRGTGAVYAAELGRDSIPVRNEMMANGVIVRPIGTCLAICPPLIITDDEVGRVLDTMAGALR